MNYDTDRLRAAVPLLLRWTESIDNRLPWHAEKTPYRVWISEIMLQQTRTAAVIPYFKRFLCACPDVASLAAIDDDRLMKLWEGLGYYSRARNLKKAAVRIMEQHGGQIPETAEQLRALPGIGAYTAGAIASIAYGKSEPAVDGNVLRVVMRYLAEDDDVLKESTKRAVADALRTVYPSGADAARLTEGLMLLGERVCTPGAEASCDACPLRELCMARMGQIVSLFPVRSPKKERRIEDRTVFLLRSNGRYAVIQRPTEGLLAGMYEFPNVLGHLSAEEAAAHVRTMGFSPLDVRPVGEAKHVFSHVEWHMTGYEITVDAPQDTFYDVAYIREALAVPTAFRFYTQQLRADQLQRTL